MHPAIYLTAIAGQDRSDQARKRRMSPRLQKIR
jgi:hypothetical protein